MSFSYYSHSENDAGCKHLAKDHLFSVARLAEKFAGNAKWRSEAALSGLLHDLGKYADSFQARLRGEEQGLDHWSSGAWVALTEYQAVAAALAIQGHHIGLQRGHREALSGLNPTALGQRHPLHLRLSDSDLERLKVRAGNDKIKLEKPKQCIINPRAIFATRIAEMLDVRMLYSCLVDADFLDTEAHFNGDKQGKRYRREGSPLDAKTALTALNDFMAVSVRASTKADKNVLRARNDLWDMVSTAAGKDIGLFTLTAPTGSGKTLAMLNFALQHAIRHDLERIVLAVPFLSIIEQTAAIYRAVFNSFPDNYVLEHHSLAGLGSEEATTDAEADADRARRLLAENWDAPIIITTNVQLLQSLFSNRSSSCRKLHNLMDSVIMFDEAQTLPQSLAVPTLAALSHLSATYRATVLFATATQPAFDAMDKSVTRYVATGWRPVEAASEHARLYDNLRRYKVEWPRPGEKKGWVMLAEEIRKEQQVLCVVNLKKHAYALMEALHDDNNVFHLSTNLCPLHRRNVLDEIRSRLGSGLPCRMISTQCVEAGVDVDFPVVYRSLAPLDAIAQAAGRCNREGRLTDAQGNQRLGQVIVFEPEKSGDYRQRYPTHAYYQASEVTRAMLAEAERKGDDLDLNDPDLFRDYYYRLYNINNPAAQNRELAAALDTVDFVAVAKEYRLIDQAAIQVLVPYSLHRDRFEELRQRQEREGISAGWIREAQVLAVSIFRPHSEHPAWEVLIPARLRYGHGASEEWYILEDRSGELRLYDDVYGLRLPQAQQIFIA
ncbi:MAG TPA: CRISPR-associated helicase Cas3' [Desulfobacteraceae bacterium]|mgnify:CR=1 FL=1|nr:CRISPR-associated helicase Cas3' [Desulfobacteraceae bacterium]